MAPQNKTKRGADIIAITGNLSTKQQTELTSLNNLLRRPDPRRGGDVVDDRLCTCDLNPQHLLLTIGDRMKQVCLPDLLPGNKGQELRHGLHLKRWSRLGELSGRLTQGPARQRKKWAAEKWE